MNYNKHLLSLKYGIDETLPDKLFYLKIQEINILVDEKNSLCSMMGKGKIIRKEI